jgi:hypothetical protein
VVVVVVASAVVAGSRRDEGWGIVRVLHLETLRYQ